MLQVALKTMDAAPAEAKPESKKSGWWQKATSAANSAVGSVFGAGDDDAVTEGAPPKASNLLHQVASAATGAVGGAFGLAGMPIERKR
ncbi:hypothetical protein [Paraburkholderia tropica]|uniref:hypothetical protein n=1 Tax=Paraburkholderia tropica TaxID=92647 RepID=UPI003D299CAD